MTVTHQPTNKTETTFICQIIPERSSGSESLSSPPPDTSKWNNNTNKTRAASRKTRVYVVRDFILRTYSSILSPKFNKDTNQSSKISSKPIVIDVAGGKGDLSWLLCNLDGVDSIVADPRATKHASLLKSASFLRDHPLVAKERSIEGLPTFQPLAGVLPELLRNTDGLEKVTRPRNMMLHVDDTLVRCIRSTCASLLNDGADERDYSRQHHFSSSFSSWNQYWADASRKAEKCYQLINPIYHPPPDCRRITSAAEAFDSITGASLLVGFHPDQATEAILDLAVHLHIPFVIVPCCVFPSEFPDRVILDEDGKGYTRVRDYQGFIRYLRAKFPKIRVETLHFNYTRTARNVVLYTLPEDMI